MLDITHTGTHMYTIHVQSACTSASHLVRQTRRGGANAVVVDARGAIAVVVVVGVRGVGVVVLVVVGGGAGAGGTAVTASAAAAMKALLEVVSCCCRPRRGAPVCGRKQRP